MADRRKISREVKKLQKQAAANTKASIEYMAKLGIEPEGRIATFLPPDSRQKQIDRLPYSHVQRQVITYETEPGEFSAVCPFSGLPDYGTVTIKYIPGKWMLELKSLKYYLISFRNIGAAQEDITAYIYQDLERTLEEYYQLVVETVYNVRGGINTFCIIDSDDQSLNKKEE